jgi:8-oxo-dGTP pyrophosphatase MutT (NUDIX family)
MGALDRSPARIIVSADLQDWRVYPVTTDVRARTVGELPPIPGGLGAEIDTLWEAAQVRTRGALFNGRVFSTDALTPSLLTGHLTEFRRIVAQMDRPELHAVLRVRPLAVCGVVCCRDGVVLGRRPARAVYQAGMWQLPPAGSVDAAAVQADGWIDLRGQLFRELQEELGLSRDRIVEARPLCMVEHPGSHVLDLGFLLRTEISGDAVLTHARDGNGEYENLEVVPFAALTARLDRLGDGLVPPARVFLHEIGLAGDPLDACDSAG